MLEAVSSPLLINFNVNESYKTYVPSMDEQKTSVMDYIKCLSTASLMIKNFM